MQGLIESCGRRVAVLDGKTIGICLRDRGRGNSSLPDDEQLFDIVMKWLQSGRFPALRARKQYVDLGSQKTKVAVKDKSS